MENYRQNIHEKYSNYHTARRMVFPTTPASEHAHNHEIDSVVNSVKDVLSSLTTQETTETETATATTIFEAATTILQENNNVDLDILNNSNNSIFGTSTESNNILEILSNNSTILEVTNNTAIEIANNDNRTILEVINNDNSTMFSLDETTTFTSTDKPNIFDWMSDGVKHNLTMVHGVPEKEASDQTLFIILGALLGVLVATSFILLLVYISYKRSNLYTLQERASSDHSRRDISLQVSSGDQEERDSELTDDRSGYKF